MEVTILAYVLVATLVYAFVFLIGQYGWRLAALQIARMRLAQLERAIAKIALGGSDERYVQILRDDVAFAKKNLKSMDLHWLGATKQNEIVQATTAEMDQFMQVSASPYFKAVAEEYTVTLYMITCANSWQITLGFMILIVFCVPFILAYRIYSGSAREAGSALQRMFLKPMYFPEAA